MDKRPKYKARHYTTLRGKHRANTFDMNHSKIFFLTYSNENKNKNKQLRFKQT